MRSELHTPRVDVQGREPPTAKITTDPQLRPREVTNVHTETLGRFSRQAITLIEGTMGGDVDNAIELLMGEEQWDLIAQVLITASEVSARRLTDTLLAAEIFDPLIPAACMRRELRRGISQAPAALSGGAIFRDFEADDEGPGVPDHIREEAEAITASANQARRIAAQKEAALDRDSIRSRIVDKLAERAVTSEAALFGLATIARASAWEETRRSAALKLAANKAATGQLLRAGRHADLLAIADASGSDGVRTRIADAVAGAMPAATAPEYRTVLELIAEHHSDDAKRAAAKKALGG